MKKWLQDNFLPLWARETLLQDNRQLKRENRALQQRIETLEAYIQGMQTGLRAMKRIHIVNRGGDA